MIDNKKIAVRFPPLLLLLAVACILQDHHQVQGFSQAANPFLKSAKSIGSKSAVSRSRHPVSALHASSNKDEGSSTSDDEDNDNVQKEEEKEEEPDLITKEMFYRNLMELDDEKENKKPKKKSKNAKQARRVNHDNRDELPFLVQVITPPEKAYEKQLVKQQQKKNNKNKKKNGNDSDVVTETLGEFRFDKSTNSGDKIEIDDEVYLVQRSKCQYKYAGAQKFVMVRKILQVKPIQRAMQEDYLKRQWNHPPAPDVL